MSETLLAPAGPVPALPQPASWSLARRVFATLCLLALFLPLYFFGDDKYWLPLFTRYMALALFALSVDLIWGYAGLLSLGQGIYFGFGVYAIGYYLKLARTAQAADMPTGTVLLPDFMEYCRLPEVPFWVAPLADIRVALLAAVLLPTLTATLFGFVTFRLRIKGVYFALITQALLLAVFTLVINQQAYTGGVVGMTYLAKLELFGYRFTMTSLYLLVTGTLVACYLACAWLMSTKFGRILQAIRDNEYRVQALGYDTAMYKTFVFALGGLLAGVAGVLYAATTGTAGPDTLNIAFSIEVVIFVAVGGRGTLLGAVLGAVLVNLVKTYANDNLGKSWPLIVGALFILVVVFMPNGILGVLRKAPGRLARLLMKFRAFGSKGDGTHETRGPVPITSERS
jgi:urea transport system permease protein